MNTAKSTKLKRLPCYAVRLWECVTEIEKQKKARQRELETDRHAACRTEIVMGLITKKWDKQSAESLHAQFCKSILSVQWKALCMKGNVGQYPWLLNTFQMTIEFLSHIQAGPQTHICILWRCLSYLHKLRLMVLEQTLNKLPPKHGFHCCRLKSYLQHVYFQGTLTNWSKLSVTVFKEIVIYAVAFKILKSPMFPKQLENNHYTPLQK